MFEIGWTEMLVIGIIMIVVVGPKDLPKMLRTIGKTVAKMRGMAGDFQKQFNEALKEAELDDVKKSVDSLKSLNPASEIRKQLNPFERAAADVRAGLDQAMKPKPSTSSEPASPDVHPAEPLKGAAVAGVAGPETMPPAPLMADPAPPSPTASLAPSPAPVVAAAPAATSSPAATPVAANGRAGEHATVAKAAPKPARTAAAKADKPSAPARAQKAAPAKAAQVKAAPAKAAPAARSRAAGGVKRSESAK